MTGRRAIAIFTGILMVALLGAPTSAGAGGCGGVQSYETYEVRTKWNKKVYRPRETVKVEVTVLRPARKDPFGLGIEVDPPHQTPVADANVYVAFTVGVPPVFGLGKTDDDGMLKLDIPLKTKARGPIQSTTRAWKIHGNSDLACTEVEEWGRLIENPAFHIREG
ncbi:MAG: hypothetical protein ABR613_05325 [Actinomycetota bacterium]